MAALVAGYNLWRGRPRAAAPDIAYILSESATVYDSPAEIRLGVATLAHGDRVVVLQRTRNWARVRLADRRRGWIELAHLVDGPTYERGEYFRKQLEHEQAQAVGHTSGLANLRAGPSRDAPLLGRLGGNQQVEIFGRRLVERPPQPGAPASSEPPREAWYLVRADGRAGWVLGRLIILAIPDEISHYAQSINLVAWLTLNIVDDDGRAVPQYLVADRRGTTEFDFTHIRVLTWWGKRQQYATAYVESGLKGFFPIRAGPVDGTPHFRLRLLDRNGRPIQKVYRMVDTFVRPLGTVDGWESDAMPEKRPSAERRGAR